MPRSAHRGVAVAAAPGHGLRAAAVELGSEELGLVLSSESGTLSLHWQEIVSGPVRLEQEGLPISLATLYRWAVAQGESAPPDGSEMRAPGLAPGHYRLCGDLPERCVEGRLESGGALELKL